MLKVDVKVDVKDMNTLREIVDVNKRIGFMEGEFIVPENFNRMYEDEIWQLFEGEK